MLEIHTTNHRTKCLFVRVNSNRRRRKEENKKQKLLTQRTKNQTLLTTMQQTSMINMRYDHYYSMFATVCSCCYWCYDNT